MPRYTVAVSDEEGTVLYSARVDAPSEGGALVQLVEAYQAGVSGLFEDQLDWTVDALTMLKGYGAEAISPPLDGPPYFDTYISMPGTRTQCLDLEYAPAGPQPYAVVARNYSGDGECSHEEQLHTFGEDQLVDACNYLKGLIDNYVDPSR
jgi:hypothetical protein